MKTIKNPKVKIKIDRAQQTANNIYSMIYYEKMFEPGGQLPSENDLSKQLNISRATLREGIRILQSRGILTVIRGKGTFVSENYEDQDSFGLGELQSHLLKLQDLWEARLYIEPIMASLACLKATDKELLDIINIGNFEEQKMYTGEDILSLNRAFHLAIASATHNEFMIKTEAIIQRAINDSMGMQVCSDHMIQHIKADHAVILKAFEDRDVSGTRYAMSMHLRRMIRDLKLDIPKM